MAGHKKRNGGCGCGGMCGNPHCGPKRKNPSINVRNPVAYTVGSHISVTKGDVGKFYVASRDGRAFAGPFATASDAEAWSKSPKGKQIAMDTLGLDFDRWPQIFRLDDLKSLRYEPQTLLPQWRKVSNPSLNVRNPSRKVHTGSEDYRLGLFQGAMEKGKLPPPHDTSADFKRGYADGAKVAAARPAASAEALGVYKATGSQPQAGAVLYDAVKGESVATLRNPSSGAKQRARGTRKGWTHSSLHEEDLLKQAAIERKLAASSRKYNRPAFEERVRQHKELLRLARQQRNPSLNVRNPSGAKSEGSVQKFTNVSGQTGWLVYDRHGHRVGFYATKPLALEMLAFANSKRHSTSSVVSGPTRNPSNGLVRNAGFVYRIYKGYRIKDIETGEMWTVTGTAPTIRGVQRYYVRDAKGDKFSMRRDDLVQGQKDGKLVVLDIENRGEPARNPSLNVRNPMSAAARKHLAHEKGEEKAFASMMAALAEGVTVKVGAHRVRKLSKGYVVVDGERLTTTQAAAKLHRGK